MGVFAFYTIEEALEDFRQGKMIIIVDDGDAENDGVLAVAGQFASPEAVNFMLSYGRGKMTMPISEEIAGKIGVEELIWENREISRSAATVTIDSVRAADGVSAADRSRTVTEAAAEDASPADFRKPGSIVPKVALQGGVLKRTGFTEAVTDLAVMAGLRPVGLRCGGKGAGAHGVCEGTWPEDHHHRGYDPVPPENGELCKLRGTGRFSDALRPFPDLRLCE